jgi:periplasmic protein TonB
MHGLRAMRPATGRLFRRPDRRFIAAALGALAINAAVATGLMTLTTHLPPFNRPILPLVVALLEPDQPVVLKEAPPPPARPPAPPPQTKPAPSVAAAPPARPASIARAEAKQAPASIADPAAASLPAAASVPVPAQPALSAPVPPAPSITAAASPPAVNAITVPPAGPSAPGSDASPTASAPGQRQGFAAASSGASESARRTGPRVDASWAGNAAPAYPSSARRMGEQGRVKLDVHVGVDGAVIDVQLRESSGSAALDRSATEAVRKWRFRPAMVDGQPVAEWYRNWEWIFRLEG